MRPKKHFKTSVFYRVTLLVALLFLAVGLAFAGSFRGTGSSFELKAKGEGDAQQPSVVFRLSDLKEETDGENASLRVSAVYVNVEAVYAAAGEGASVRIDWANSATSAFNVSSRRAVLHVENFTPAAQTEEEATQETAKLFDWAAFPVGDGWRVSQYSYVRIIAPDHNVRIGEVVFVGEKLADGEGTGERCVVPAAVYSATPLVGESAEEAAAAAGALVDRQGSIPTAGGYRFTSYSAGERTVLATISEMRAGSAYGEGNVYEGERVYGALGVDILALGTLIFGMSPFGLRFFPMLAAFGALLAGAAFVRRMAGSDRAGLVFAVLFALAGATLALGGLGTPLMLGVFFLFLSLDLCHRFYAKGMPSAGFAHAAKLIGAGLAGACAICVNGAFVIPVAGVAALFAAGMVRQARARRYYLDKAIETAEAAPQEERQQAALQAGEVAAEYRRKHASAAASFVTSLLIGTLAVALLALLPVYYAYVKLYDDPASPALNIFTLMWKAFAGGFTGVNAGVDAGTGWELFPVLLRTDGGAHAAVWGAFVNPACLLAVLFAVVYFVGAIVVLARRGEWGKTERKLVRVAAITAGGALVSVLSALVAADAAAFVLLAYLFAFALAAVGSDALMQAEGRVGKAARVTGWVLLGLLAAMFALYFVFLTGLPLSSALVTRLFG